MLQLWTESGKAVEVKCNHYYICSKVQSLSYDEQIIEKSNQVEGAFRRLGGFSDFKLKGKVEADKIFNYRNKMEFTFSPHRWVLDSEPEGVNKSFALGLHMTGRYDKILDAFLLKRKKKLQSSSVSVTKIINDVKRNGDKALLKYEKKFNLNKTLYVGNDLNDYEAIKNYLPR